MILAVDVDYREKYAVVAGIVFENWSDPEPLSQYTVELQDVPEYVPGEFYRRELPAIKKILEEEIKEDITIIVVDGYVYLGEEQRAGLGKKLYDVLEPKIP